MATATDFTDACEKYSAGDVLQWWTTIGSLGSIGFNDYTPQLAALTNPVAFYKGGLTAQSARTVIMRGRFSGTPGSTVNLLRFMSGTNVVGMLSINTSNQLLWRNSAGGALSTADATSALDTSNFHVIEAGYFLDAANGRVQLRIDGATIAVATSIALGGSVNNTLSTNGGFANSDAIELSGGIPQTIDFFITRTNAGVWTTPTDWMADATTPFFLKKKTVQLLRGAAGNGAFQPGGTTFTIGAALPGDTSQSDVLGHLPFVGDSSYLSVVSGAGNPTLDSLKIQQIPTEVSVVKTVSYVWAARCTAAQYDHKGFVNFTGAHPGQADPNTYTSTTAYGGHTWCMDKIPTDSAAWDVATLNTPMEIGQHNLAIS